MRRRAATWAVLLLGCSSLTGDNGIVALETRFQSPAVVETDDTLTLRARALNAEGDSVDAPIIWRTPDTTLIVDSTGTVTTALTAGTGRVQAQSGSLRSNLVTLTIRPRSDTLVIVPPDTLIVPLADTISGPLGAQVLSFNPAGGVSGTSILFEVVDSASVRGVLHFSNGGLALRVTTSSSGDPLQAVTLRRTKGVTPPAEAQVQVSAVRPSGTPVPGSGQRFTLLFQ